MTYTKTSICKMALAHCGITTTMSDVDTDNTNEARQCRNFFDHCRDLLLEMRPWAFCEREVSLTNLGDPPDVWGYRYEYPNNAKRINRIVDTANRSPQSLGAKIPFKVRDYYDPNTLETLGKEILTDREDAVANINWYQTDPAFFSAAFAQAQALFVASMVATPLRIKAALAERIAQQWNAWLQEADILNKMEQQDDVPPDSEFVSGRA